MDENEVAKVNSSQYLNNRNSFYYGSQFQNWSAIPMAYALDIELEKLLGTLLKLPSDRIIYSSLEYCFRERGRKNNGELNIPFLTYYRNGYSQPSDRDWFNNRANTLGLYDLCSQSYETRLGTKLKIYPCQVEYECAVFFSQQKDCEYAMNKLMMENSNETLLYPMLETSNGDILKNIAIPSFDLEFNPDYQESDWLEQNRIWSIGIGITADTLMIGDIDDDVHVATSVQLDFMTGKDLDSLQQVQQYFIQ